MVVGVGVGSKNNVGVGVGEGVGVGNGLLFSIIPLPHSGVGIFCVL